MTDQELFESKVERRLQIPEWQQIILRLDGYTLDDNRYATVCGRKLLNSKVGCDNEIVILVNKKNEYSLVCGAHAKYMTSWKVYEI